LFPANGRLSSITAFRADRSNQGLVPCVEARIGGGSQAANFSGVRHGRARRQQGKMRRGVGPLNFSRNPKVQRSSSPPHETARCQVQRREPPTARSRLPFLRAVVQTDASMGETGQVSTIVYSGARRRSRAQFNWEISNNKCETKRHHVLDNADPDCRFFRACSAP
jgi:hypothetical protein